MGNQNPNMSGGWQSSPTPDTSKLAGQAERAAEKIANSAVDRVQEARDKAESGLSQQRGQLTQRIRRVGDALRTTSDELRLEDEVVADYLDQAGDRVERLASYVKSANPSDMVRDVQRFATERPAWFFGGTFLLGLAAGRFLKSSAAQKSDSQFSYDSRRQGQMSSSRSMPNQQGVTTVPSTTVVDRPVSSAGYSEPRTYGSAGTGSPGGMGSTGTSSPGTGTPASTSSAGFTGSAGSTGALGTPGSNGDKAKLGTTPGTGPGSRTS